MKVDAAFFNESFAKMPKHLLDSQANDLLTERAGILKHKIGYIHIYELNGIYISVNSQSLAMVYYDTEDEAVDFYLDHIEATKEYTQQSFDI